MTGYVFCPYCAERYLEQGQVQTCGSCHRTVWHKSAPSSGAMVISDGRLLLVKRGVEPFKGWWDIPGGFLDPGEHPVEGAAREVLEETGLQVALEDLVGVYIDQYGDDQRYTLNMYYVGRVIGGELLAGDDAVALEWFGLDELPDRVAFNHTRQAIADLRLLLEARG